MNQAGEFSIALTTSKDKLSICAQMMSKTAPWKVYLMSYQQCLQAFEGQCKEIYLLESEKVIAGFVILQVCGSFKGYIQTLCVDEPYRSFGYGRKLLEFSEERIRLISPNLFICVSSFNQRAIKIYEEFGFKLVGELPDFVKTGITELLLRKTYGPMLGYEGYPSKPNC